MLWRFIHGSVLIRNICILCICCLLGLALNGTVFLLEPHLAHIRRHRLGGIFDARVRPQICAIVLILVEYVKSRALAFFAQCRECAIFQIIFLLTHVLILVSHGPTLCCSLCLHYILMGRLMRRRSLLFWGMSCALLFRVRFILVRITSPRGHLLFFFLFLVLVGLRDIFVDI